MEFLLAIAFLALLRVGINWEDRSPEEDRRLEETKRLKRLAKRRNIRNHKVRSSGVKKETPFNGQYFDALSQFACNAPQMFSSTNAQTSGTKSPSDPSNSNPYAFEAGAPGYGENNMNPASKTKFGEKSFGIRRPFKS